jgi:hypothetical protein
MRLWTDFNYMEDENRVWADLDLAEFYREDQLQVGQKAQLFDGLGYECVGTIVAVDRANRMVELELDRATWRSVRDRDSEREFVASVKYEGEFVSAGKT